MTQVIQDSMLAIWTKIAAFVPNLAAMLVILVVGFIVSKVLQWTATSVLKRLHFDMASERAGLSETMTHVGIRRTASEIVGILVFWLVMLTFLITAAETLGLENVSRTVDSFVRYLPNVIGAAVILVVGMLLANFVRTAIHAGMERIGIEYAGAAAKLAYGVMIVVIGSLAIGQLHIETALINRIIEITLMATGAALAIALGLGTRDIARHVVAGVYARESFKTGARLTVGDRQGEVEAVTAVNTKIRTNHGETVYVPNAQLIDSLVCEDQAASNVGSTD